MAIFNSYFDITRGYHQAELTSEIPRCVVVSSRQGVVQLGPVASARAAPAC